MKYHIFLIITTILIIDYEEKISNYFALLNKSKYTLQKTINLIYRRGKI